MIQTDTYPPEYITWAMRHCFVLPKSLRHLQVGLRKPATLHYLANLREHSSKFHFQGTDYTVFHSHTSLREIEALAAEDYRRVQFRPSAKVSKVWVSLRSHTSYGHYAIVQIDRPATPTYN